VRVPRGKGVASYCIENCMSVRIEEAYEDQRFDPEIDKDYLIKTKTVMCMPIKNS